MKKYITAGLLISFFLPSFFSVQGLSAIAFAADAKIIQSAQITNDVKAEFDVICGKTDDAMSLSEAELKSLIEECEKLRPKIEALDESTKKVYLKRLKACQDLFAYVLESKQTKQPVAQ